MGKLALNYMQDCKKHISYKMQLNHVGAYLNVGLTSKYCRKTPMPSFAFSVILALNEGQAMSGNLNRKQL